MSLTPDGTLTLITYWPGPDGSPRTTARRTEGGNAGNRFHSTSSGRTALKRVCPGWWARAIGALLVWACYTRFLLPASAGLSFCRSALGDIDDRFGEGPGRLLRQVVADPAGHHPERVPARELPGVRARLRVRRAVGVALEGDGRHGDGRRRRKALLQVVVPRLAVGESEPPAVVVDHDRDVVRVVERRRAALEGGVVE